MKRLIPLFFQLSVVAIASGVFPYTALAADRTSDGPHFPYTNGLMHILREFKPEQCIQFGLGDSSNKYCVKIDPSFFKRDIYAICLTGKSNMELKEFIKKNRMRYDIFEKDVCVSSRIIDQPIAELHPNEKHSGSVVLCELEPCGLFEKAKRVELSFEYGDSLIQVVIMQLPIP